MILCEGDVLRRAIDIRAAEAVVSVIFRHGLTMDRVDPQPDVACCRVPHEIAWTHTSRKPADLFA
jgi:hypothetical protein